ncbi:Protein T23F4.2 [Aphelenchoides avenae]|nr:Protein T23F4.2 [Aphelenchus avenae]
MIGIINVNDTTATEFMAAPRLAPRPIVEESSQSTFSTEHAKLSRQRTNNLSIFHRRRFSTQVAYLEDGRKLYNGQLVEMGNVSELWQQLIIRSFVRQIEEEVQSPVEHLNAVEANFSFLAPPRRGRSKSTFSLVSDERISRHCEKFAKLKHSFRSFSAPRICRKPRSP